MFVQLPFWLFSLTGLMALGALIALGIVLWRGDLCPGQRSRITNQLFSIWVITGLSLMLGIEAGVTGWLIWCGGAALILGIVLSLAQSRLEGKRAIPASLLWLPAMPLALYGLGLLQIQGWLNGALQMVLLGSAFAHLMLLRARHRLQAFNLLLPLAGRYVSRWMSSKTSSPSDSPGLSSRSFSINTRSWNSKPSEVLSAETASRWPIFVISLYSNFNE